MLITKKNNKKQMNGLQVSIIIFLVSLLIMSFLYVVVRGFQTEAKHNKPEKPIDTHNVQLEM